MLLNYKLSNENDELKRDILKLKIHIKELNEEINALKCIKSIVDKITGGKIEWFDYFKLTTEQQRFYYNEAKVALENKAVKNEINKIISEFSNWCLTQSNDFKDVEALRYQISGMKLLLERLEEIPDPDSNKDAVEEPFNAI